LSRGEKEEKEGEKKRTREKKPWEFTEREELNMGG